MYVWSDDKSFILGVVNVGVVKVLFVSVSVVALPTKVSVDVGSVMVPVFDIVDITGVVKVLFVSVCVWSLNTNSSFPVSRGRVTTLLLVNSLGEKIYVWSSDVSFILGVVKVADVNVLFVRVSVVALPTKVSVDVGSVKVPVLDIVDIIGVVRVLLVNVSVVALPTNVSVDVGSVKVPVLTI